MSIVASNHLRRPRLLLFSTGLDLFITPDRIPTICPTGLLPTHSALGLLSRTLASGQTLIDNPVLGTMTAPMTDHRDSCDNAPYYQQTYSGDHHYGLNGFVLTDRNLSVHTAAMPMVVRADQMYSTAGYAAQHSRDNHHFLASTVNTQLTPAPLNYPSSGTPPIQTPGAVYSYQVPEERHSHLRMSGVGNSLHHSMADERPYSDAPRSQIHQPYWFSAETGSNTRIGRSMNQYQQHTLASVDQASLCSSRQYPKEEVPEYGVADLVTDEGVPTTQPAVAYRPRYQHGYASTAEFDDTLARGNYQAYQHNLSTNDDEENFHGDRASDSNHQ